MNLWRRFGRKAVAEADVSALFGLLLKREPEPAALAFYAGRLRRYGLGVVLEAIVKSPEYREKSLRAPDLGLSAEPRLAVETDLALEQLDALWRHVSQVWTSLGVTDPYWSVLTDERYRKAAMNDAAVIDAFYASGAGDLAYLSAFLDRSGLALRPDMVLAEYGCGVGRVTRLLAQRVGQVIAFDISLPHLDAARARLRQEGLDNVEYVHVRERADLSRLANIDVFFSKIVLQHNPPPVIIDILKSAFAALQPGGLAFFQVPVYARDYEFSIDKFWRTVALDKAMEMHVVPQPALLRVARDCGMILLETTADGAVGDFPRWLSHTFLMQKV